MKALEEYQSLVAQVDTCCRKILDRYADQIACEKGCAGNCCRIHLSIFPVEAVSLALALKRLPIEKVHYLRRRARHSTLSGPCPLLEEGACRMYASRLIICRTHGIPMRNEYRGRQSVGCCRKNFQHSKPIPRDAVIDLNDLNNRLAEVNRQFISEFSGCMTPGSRLSIGKALLLEV